MAPGWLEGRTKLGVVYYQLGELEAPVEIPVVVVAETLRGGFRDAPVHRTRETPAAARAPLLRLREIA